MEVLLGGGRSGEESELDPELELPEEAGLREGALAGPSSPELLLEPLLLLLLLLRAGAAAGGGGSSSPEELLELGGACGLLLLSLPPEPFLPRSLETAFLRGRSGLLETALLRGRLGLLEGLCLRGGLTCLPRTTGDTLLLTTSRLLDPLLLPCFADRETLCLCSGLLDTFRCLLCTSGLLDTFLCLLLTSGLTETSRCFRLTSGLTETFLSLLLVS